jgi:hypothetical protein
MAGVLSVVNRSPFHELPHDSVDVLFSIGAAVGTKQDATLELGP